jgi:hypothetical protein
MAGISGQIANWSATVSKELERESDLLPLWQEGKMWIIFFLLARWWCSFGHSWGKHLGAVGGLPSDMRDLNNNWLTRGVGVGYQTGISYFAGFV